MPSTDRKLELQAKDIDVSTVSQPAVCVYRLGEPGRLTDGCVL